MEELRRKLLSAALGDLAVSTGLPEGYVPCEYIESFSNNLIDTGVSGGNSAAYEIKFNNYRQISNQATYFGTSYPRSAIPSLCSSNVGYNQIKFSSYDDEGYILSQEIVEDDYVVHTISVKDSGYKNTSISVDGNYVQLIDSLYACLNNRGWGDSNWHIFGAGSSGGYSRMRIYYLKMWTDDILVRDFIPCLNPEGVFGLYDKVEGDFKTTITGYQLYGKICTPKGYEVIDCLYNSGGARLDTGEFLNGEPFKLYCSWIPQDESAAVVGCIDNGFAKMVLTNGSLTTVASIMGSMTTEVPQSGVRDVILTEKNMYTWDRSMSYSAIMDFQSSMNLSPSWGSSAVADLVPISLLGNCFICKNGTLVKCFVPCRKNGICGMYDWVTNQFYTSSTDIEFEEGII